MRVDQLVEETVLKGIYVALTQNKWKLKTQETVTSSQIPMFHLNMKLSSLTDKKR